MKYLIVNGDDLGASPGINRGIIEAHCSGILTSASLMVDTPWSAEAAMLSLSTPELSVGLHAVLPEEDARYSPADELTRQFARFAELMGRPPTHLDSHHNVHRRPEMLPEFLECSRRLGVPLREHSSVHYFPRFYGQWSGESHPEQVSFQSLIQMLEKEIPDGITELSCHPGYADPLLLSTYVVEREVELNTLCDPRVPAVLAAQGITLISYHQLGSLAAIQGGE